MGSNWSTGFASIQLTVRPRACGRGGSVRGRGDRRRTVDGGHAGMAEHQQRFALQQELCRRAGGHAEAALRSARLVAVGFGPSSQTQGREIGQETQATQSAKHVVVFAQRRGVYPSARAFAVVVLGVPVVGAQRTIRGTTPRTRELEGFSAADDGRLARGVAAMEVFGRLLRHDQQRQTDANAASADGDAGAGAIPFAFALRTDALERARASHRTPLGARLAAQRPGPDGPRILELRAVLADCPAGSVFRHSPAQ